MAKNSGAKNDKSKPPVDLLPSWPLVEIAKVLGFGAGKYSRYNWAEGMDWSRPTAALMRHVLAWKEGEDLDEESGLSHLAHAGCCILFLLAYQRYGLGRDDRWRPGLKGEELIPEGGGGVSGVGDLKTPIDLY